MEFICWSCHGCPAADTTTGKRLNANKDNIFFMTMVSDGPTSQRGQKNNGGEEYQLNQMYGRMSPDSDTTEECYKERHTEINHETMKD